MNKQKEYFPDDRVIIIDKDHVHYKCIGRIKKMNYKNMEYMISLENSDKRFTTVKYNQIDKYIEEEDLKDLIELSLIIGQPAKEMFKHWVKLLNKIKR
jgi:hydrogenase maturation factor HypE